MSLVERRRFESMVSLQADGCWLWTAYIERDGYARLWFRRRFRSAHRVAWWHKFGPVPAGLVLDHTCRKRNCVNPWHLEAVTSRQNTLAGVGPSALNARKVACPLGHPFDRSYTAKGRLPVRYCSICSNAKKRRLRLVWASQPDMMSA